MSSSNNIYNRRVYNIKTLVSSGMDVVDAWERTTGHDVYKGRCGPTCTSFKDGSVGYTCCRCGGMLIIKEEDGNLSIRGDVKDCTNLFGDCEYLFDLDLI